MRLGYWISEKKSKKMNFDEFASLCRNVGIELVKIDLDASLEEQGPFDLIVHKLTDVLAKVGEGFDTAKQRMHRFQVYTEQHPECIILDALDNIQKLLDRYEQYKVVQQCDLLGSHVFTPSFVELTTTDAQTNKKKLKKANVTYPIVCKPTVAHGSQFSHQMSLVFNDAGLKDIHPPCVAQTFINHGARLYKLFVVGNYMRLVERPSLRNFSAGDHETIFFDAHDVSKPDSCHDLNMLDEDNDKGPVQPDMKKMQGLADDLRSLLKMDLFGVDVIIDCDTSRYAVIDINFFPGYEGLPDFFPLLLKLSQELLTQRDAKESFKLSNNNEKGVCHVIEAESELQNGQHQMNNGYGTGLEQECGHKRLKLDHGENGKRLTVELGLDKLSAEQTTVLAVNGLPSDSNSNHGNGTVGGRSGFTNGHFNATKRPDSKELDNGIVSVKNGLVTLDTDRQLL